MNLIFNIKEGKKVKIDKIAKIDKGHEQEIIEIAKALQGNENLTPKTNLDIISSKVSIEISKER